MSAPPMFQDNMPLAQYVLRILTGIRDLVLIHEETQKDVKQLAGGRSVCLDVTGIDSKGTVYDLEIQRSDKGTGAHRARYHSSMMDRDLLKECQDFDEIPDTYTIFITENDIYQEGKPFYIIERINLTTGKSFNDGEHILYVNGQYRGDDEIGDLMYDFNCDDPHKMKSKEMAERAIYLKETKEGVAFMCKQMEDMRNETIRSTTTEYLKNIMKTLKISLNQAMDALQIPEKDRAQYTSRIKQ